MSRTIKIERDAMAEQKISKEISVFFNETPEEIRRKMSAAIFDLEIQWITKNDLLFKVSRGRLMKEIKRCKEPTHANAILYFEKIFDRYVSIPKNKVK